MIDYNLILDNISNITNTEIPYNAREKLIKYSSLVIDYNNNINITGSKSKDDFFNEHIADCLLALKIFHNCDNIIDIGCGSGLPSIPLAIVYKNRKFTLCESKNKKAEFLRLAKYELNLKNIEILCTNAYEIKQKYDIITSRAFSDISSLLKIFNKIKSNNARLLAYKGKMDKIEEELKEVNIKKYGYKVNIEKLLNSYKERHIVIISN